jgi:tRNA threonylcarbamoyladenosine biosynthesis protein TsaE
MGEFEADSAVPRRLRIPTAAAMDRLGRRLAKLLRAGDLVLLDGELGAGKTALTQGIGAGLEVKGPVISPTFVLARVHPSRQGGPALVHVDAYRLSDAAEIDDLDLEASMSAAVTVVEWGQGLAEHLASDRLDILIERSGDPADETRWVTLRPAGRRWAGSDLAALGDGFSQTAAKALAAVNGSPAAAGDHDGRPPGQGGQAAAASGSPEVAATAASRRAGSGRQAGRTAHG